MTIRTYDDATHVAVPREATEAMVTTGRNNDDLADRSNVRRIYRAMLASAPRPEGVEYDIAALRAAEPPDMRKLRYLLALAFSGSKLYRDDGEYSDASERPFIDFRRDPVAEIERKIRERNIARLNEQINTPPTTPDAERDAKYAELIYAVESKHAGETRHQTALRYIRQAEQRPTGPAQPAIDQAIGKGE